MGFCKHLKLYICVYIMRAFQPHTKTNQSWAHVIILIQNQICRWSHRDYKASILPQISVFAGSHGRHSAGGLTPRSHGWAKRKENRIQKGLTQVFNIIHNKSCARVSLSPLCSVPAGQRSERAASWFPPAAWDNPLLSALALRTSRPPAYWQMLKHTSPINFLVPDL